MLQSYVVSAGLSIPLDPTAKILIPIGAYLPPYSYSLLANVKNSSSLADSNSGLLSVIRSSGLLLYLFPGINLAIAVLAMPLTLHRGVIFWYILKIFGEFCFPHISEWWLYGDSH